MNGDDREQRDMEIIARMKDEAWFQRLLEERQKEETDAEFFERERRRDELLAALANPDVQLAVARLLDTLARVGPPALTNEQRRAQLEGAILVNAALDSDRIALRGDPHDGTQGIDWFKKLSRDEQERVLLTVQGNRRIRNATIPPPQRAAKPEVPKTNPWHSVLNP